jgi:hypothetical protein
MSNDGKRSEESRVFWAAILSFLTDGYHKYPKEFLLAQLKLACVSRAHDLLARWAFQHLPLSKIHQKRWEAMMTFFVHPTIRCRAWSTKKVYQQLCLAARDEHGDRIGLDCPCDLLPLCD